MSLMELALPIALGMTIAILSSVFCLWIFWGNKVFELYQRFTWLQKDIHQIATKKEEA